MSTPSPSEARDALNRVHEIRRTAVDSLRTPWWLWAALGVVVMLVFAANDYGSAVQAGASLGLGALAVAWVVAGRLSPRVAAVSGVPHRSTSTGHARLAVVLIALTCGIGSHFAAPAVHRMLTGSGMPAWIREHPYTTAALPFALLSLAVALLMNTVARRTARRPSIR
jgi:ABC-type amino acid transport system permease subunit